MSVVPLTASPQSDAEPAAESSAADAGQQMLGIKKTLEEAASQLGSLQSSLDTQRQLEQLLKQGRTHLQELRGRLLRVTAERDQLQTEFSDSETAHRREVEELQRQTDDLRDELQKATAERNRLTTQLDEQETSHKRFAEERSDERSTFERLLLEATSNHRGMVEDLNEQRQQIETLREAAMRAQSLAREIMRAHETLQTKTIAGPKK